MGRRGPHGGRAFADGTARLLRTLATDRRPGWIAAERRRGLSALIFVGRRLSRLGLAHCISDQRCAGGGGSLYPAQGHGDTSLQSHPAGGKNCRCAGGGFVQDPRKKHASRAGRALYRRSNFQYLRRVHYRLSYRRVASAAANSAGRCDDIVGNHDHHAAYLRQSVRPVRPPTPLRAWSPWNWGAVVPGILADADRIAGAGLDRDCHSVRLCLSGSLWAAGGVILGTVRHPGALYRNIIRLSILRYLCERPIAYHRHGLVAAWRQKAMADLPVRSGGEPDKCALSLCHDGVA